MSNPAQNPSSPPITAGKIRFLPPDGDRLWPHVSRWEYRHWRAFLLQHGWTEAAVKQYYSSPNGDRYTYGFGLQIGKKPWKWFYHPIPRAVSFHACKTPNILYGGAAGGAKSHSARWDAYRHCWSIPEFTAIIMRRTHQELKRNHMKFVVREADAINKYLGREVLDWAPSEFELRFRHNGSLILFGHCQNEGDEEKYLSDEYDAFYPDEIATFTQAQILGVASRLRSTKEGVRPRLGGTSNPGGTHTLWCLDYFVHKQIDPEIDPMYDPQDWTYIHARLYDNPHIMDSDGTYTTYEKRLSARGPIRRRQLMDGDWTAITGQFFPEFSAAHIRHLHIPDGCVIERWIDWGYVKPGVCYWVACLPNGRLYVFHEYKFQETIAKDVARQICDETADVLRQIPGSRVRKTVADPAMFGPDGQTGEDYSETFGRYGVPLVKANNDRVIGWGRLRSWLSICSDGMPWLVIAPPGTHLGGCPYAIRTLPAAVSDDHDPEDINTEGDDHACDAIRYGVMARPSPTPHDPDVTPTLPNSIKELLNQAQRSDGPYPSRPFGTVR